MVKFLTISIALALVAPLVYAMSPFWGGMQFGTLWGVSAAIWLILAQMTLLVLLCAAALALQKPDTGDEL